MNVSGISPSFPGLSLSVRLVTHALLTRPPLRYRFASFLYISVRLACVKHAASVRPEPGSNSPLISKSCSSSFFLASLCCPLTRSSLAFRFFATVQFSRIKVSSFRGIKLYQQLYILSISIFFCLGSLTLLTLVRLGFSSTRDSCYLSIVVYLMSRYFCKNFFKSVIGPKKVVHIFLSSLVPGRRYAYKTGDRH